MLKKLFKVMKKVVIAGLVIYTYNVLAVSINATIPINFVTLSLVTFLGIPSLVGLIVTMLVFF